MTLDQAEIEIENLKRLIEMKDAQIKLMTIQLDSLNPQYVEMLAFIEFLVFKNSNWDPDKAIENLDKSRAEFLSGEW